MRPLIGLGAAGFALATALAASPVHAQSPAMVSITFRLTVNGAPSPQASFGVEQQVELCMAPCLGGGHMYSKTIPWLKGTTPVQFVFARFVFVGNGTPQPVQEFARVTVIPTSDQTVTAFYTFGSAAAAVSTPSTGAGEPSRSGAVLAGAGLVWSGIGLLWLVSRRGRRSTSMP